MSDTKLIVSSTPHVRSEDSIEKVMADVLVALAPATLASVYYFGFRAAFIILLCVAWCLIFEMMYERLAGKPYTIRDCSAAVTGVLLALNLPVTVPFWLPPVGAFVAIVIVKQLFGGLGQNFMNPALLARAFLQTSFTSDTVGWVAPVRSLIGASGPDAVSSATPLALLKEGVFTPQSADYLNALLGSVAGSMGETSSALIILGGLYLILRKVISWHIPVSYLGLFGLLSFIFGRQGLFTGLPLYEILTGGILLGALFMATDYATSPITPLGKIIMGLGCALLTFIIRTYGSYPEGVCYSILLMNLAVPLIDRLTKPRVFGTSGTSGPTVKEARS
ncbi:MAG: RnfABCDGE type electron transport complex subunit D [Clostridiales bacterium]|jgi:electron transport complex protein RnfD|nr:RnfABCDGE type electron transport complex subunit D [Clostridiales bacterium]